MNNIKAIIFDVDETLTDRISWYYLTEGLGADPEEHRQIFESFKNGELDYPEAKRRLIELWQATGNATKSYLTQMFQSWTIKQEAYEIIPYLKQKYQVCLISGAVDLYVQSVAEKLGITDFYANTELVWQEDKLVDLNYFADQSGKKLEHLKEYLGLNHLQMHECVAIGDGESDTQLFLNVPNSLAITADENSPILQTASYRIHSLSEIQKYL